MSKQKRTLPPGAAEQRDPLGRGEHRRAEHGRGPEAEDLGLGNQALQAQLGGGAVESVGFDVVRDAAFPLVERAALALQIEPRGAAEVSRFVEILQRSHLPEERRALLVDRILTDQAVAEGIGGALERWFGDDSVEVRDAVVETLDAVLDGLHGTEHHGAWHLPDGRSVAVADDTLDGSVAVRAEALVRDLANGLATSGLAPAGRSAGEAVRGFCRDVQLALLWDEEEEEELGGDYAAEESGV